MLGTNPIYWHVAISIQGDDALASKGPLSDIPFRTIPAAIHRAQAALRPLHKAEYPDYIVFHYYFGSNLKMHAVWAPDLLMSNDKIDCSALLEKMITEQFTDILKGRKDPTKEALWPEESE